MKEGGLGQIERGDSLRLVGQQQHELKPLEQLQAMSTDGIAAHNAVGALQRFSDPSLAAKLTEVDLNEDDEADWPGTRTASIGHNASVADKLNLVYDIVDLDEEERVVGEHINSNERPATKDKVEIKIGEEDGGHVKVSKVVGDMDNEQDNYYEDCDIDSEFDEILLRDRLDVPGCSTKDLRVSPVWSEDGMSSNHPLGRRLAPLGQDREDQKLTEFDSWREGARFEDNQNPDREELEEKVRQMEAEQEELTDSLQAITSHYARLQLRLEQVMAAPAENREPLLSDLQKFAFMPIPNITKAPDIVSEEGREKVVSEQRRVEADAITSLRDKLEELESYAFQAGEADTPPSSVVLHRQKIIMEQLKERLNLEVSDIVNLSEAELKAEVDSRLGQIVNPLKMKTKLVSQLQTQITDLENFIQFLQEESTVLPDNPACGCGNHEKSTSGCTPSCSPIPPNARRKSVILEKRKKMGEERKRKLEEQKFNLNLLKRAAQALQTASSVATLGCGSNNGFRSNSLKSAKDSHYGDMRARLELAVENLLDVCNNSDSCTRETASNKDDIPHDTEFLARSPQVTSTVRKQLCTAIRDLIHHGLGQRSGGVRSMLPFSGCMSGRKATSAPTTSGILHAWDVITRFYELKGGAEYNSAPARRLSRSFGLDLAPTGSNNKQVLLQTIGQILSHNTAHKRTPDQLFKAFISSGLNKRKLVPWLRMIVRNQTILETMYEPWSYVATTGFDDALRLLERLSLYVFDLPTNLSANQPNLVEEAF